MVDWGIAMKLQLSSCVVRVLVFIVTVATMVAFCEERTENALASAFPADSLGLVAAHGAVAVAVEPLFVGAYLPDGIFKASSKRNHLLDVPTRQPQLRPAEVPPWFDLQPIERVVEDFAPPVHLRQPMRAKSRFASLRDNFVTLAYGRERVLLNPTHVTTDSRQRIVLSDPDEPAIHVLDGADSFRIMGGPQHRLQHPNGVAVDDQDNIYVADGKLGTILVYDVNGVYLRTIGDFKGEAMFQNPTGIAIDREARRLYVLDSPVNQLVVLDLNGRTVKRIGSIRDRSGVRFESPTAISVGKSAIVVLDMYGSRIQVLDFEGNNRGAFRVRNLRGLTSIEMGVAQDSDGNIYVSNLESASVRIYRPDGRTIGDLKQPGTARAKFSGASHIWIDPENRIYVADTSNSRVLVFQSAGKVALAGGSKLKH